MSDQIALPLEFPWRPALGRDAFFVSESNALAVAMLDAWQTWPARKLALIAPKGAGKTHLAHVWAEQTGAQILSAADLAEADIPALAMGCVCVEDLEDLFGHPEREAALFHLHNLTLAEGHSLLLTARSAPSRWAIGLPDLASRMQGTPVTEMGDPDDGLLAAVIAKLFADRQIVPAKGVIPYLLPRMPRSFAAAERYVAALDAEALRQKKDITRDLARTVIDTLEGG